MEVESPVWAILQDRGDGGLAAGSVEMVGQVQDTLWGHSLLMDCCLSGERGIKQNFDLATRWVALLLSEIVEERLFWQRGEVLTSTLISL